MVNLLKAMDHSDDNLSPLAPHTCNNCACTHRRDFMQLIYDNSRLQVAEALLANL
jgi:hypothetical protein